MVYKTNVGKHCQDCNSYHERTAGEGYCSEWDTIVNFSDTCIKDKEMQLFLHLKKECIEG